MAAILRDPSLFRRHGKAILSSVAFQSLCAFGLFWIFHRLLVRWMTQSKTKLGDVGPEHFAPLYAECDPRFTPWILPAAFAIALFISFNRRLKHGFAAVSAACLAVIAVSVSMIDGFQTLGNRTVPATIVPYSRVEIEYYGDVAKIDQGGLAEFLRDYSKPHLFDTLSGHSQTHPPGGVVFLWVIAKLLGGSLAAASAGSILFVALSVFSLYGIARRVYGEDAARISLSLFALTPNVVMFAATSMDGPFMVFPSLGAYLFFRALEPAAPKRSALTAAALAGTALAFGFLMTYASAVMGVFLALIALFISLKDPSRRGSAIQTLSITAGSCLVVLVVLCLATGFNLPEAFVASFEKDEANVGSGYESVDRFLLLSVGGLAAFFMGIGLPMTVVWIRQIAASVRGGGYDGFTIGSAASFLAIGFSTLFTMEVERQWLFLAPFVVIPAARYLSKLPDGGQVVLWVQSLLGLQLLLSEATLNTYW